MANNFICNMCPVGSTTYPNLVSLQAHIKEVHIPQRRSEFKIPPSKVREAEAMKNSEKLEAQSVVIPQQPTEKPQEGKVPPPTNPIVLQYSYIGGCNYCGVPVETHEIKVRAGLYMIAWCSSCQKQLKDIKVIPIEDQMELEIDEELDDGSFPITKFKKKK